MRRTMTVAALLWLVVFGQSRVPDRRRTRPSSRPCSRSSSRARRATTPAAHERFWADSLVYTRSSGRRIGKAEILKDVRSAPPAALAPGHTAPRTCGSSSSATTAVVAFRLVATTSAPGFTERDEFLNTGTFVRRDGRWQAVAWQATRAPPTEADARLQVAAFDKAFHAALLAADVKTLDSLLDDGFAWTHSDGHKLSGSELVAELESGKLRYTKLETSGVTTWVRDGTAVVRGDSLRQRSANPATPGKGDPEPRAIFYTLTLVHGQRRLEGGRRCTRAGAEAAVSVCYRGRGAGEAEACARHAGS